MKMIYKFGYKVFAQITLVILTVLFCACVAGAFFVGENNGFDMSSRASESADSFAKMLHYQDIVFYSTSDMQNDGYSLLTSESAEIPGRIKAFSIYDNTGHLLKHREITGFEPQERDYTVIYTYKWEDDILVVYNEAGHVGMKLTPIGSNSYYDANGIYGGAKLELIYDRDFAPYGFNQNTLSFEEKMMTLIFNLRFWFIGIGVFSFIGMVFIFTTLVRGAGRYELVVHEDKTESCEITGSWGEAVPFDIVLFSAVVSGGCLIAMAAEFLDRYGLLFKILGAICLIGVEVVAVWLFMSFSVRVKRKNLIKNTVCYRLIKLFIKCFEKLWHFAKAVIKSIPGIPKTILFLGIVLVADFVFFSICMSVGSEGRAFHWIVSKILFVAFVMYFAIVLLKIKKGAKAIQSGELNYKIDTKTMFLDVKEGAELINNIGEGLNNAVAEKVKSEHMKTELITNVSHDIKTPLTSIINYSDLISKEETDNEKIKEYSEVLLRQSTKMKRLMEDLVEVSKATTGNLDVELLKVDAGIFVGQAAGEYEEKLVQSELSLVVKKPDYPVYIMADGRRMWRVFDNLMNNICKYAQCNTRVFLELAVDDGKAVISFKNTSKDMLNVNADELMERFVRGDSSRNTEGNGLGLSIAKSLTELQNGSFKLVVDGDLFKVVLEFEECR